MKEVIGAGLHIIGAGMAGLLAANMMKRRAPQIWESQVSLPNNHSAVLRFRSSTVGDVLDIPFRKVTMIKTTARWMNPVADAMAYAKKNTGQYLSDRSINSYELLSVERYIAPHNLISLMSRDLKIELNSTIDYNDIRATKAPIISTVPMPLLMEMLKYPHRDSVKFRYKPGLNLRASVDQCDAFVTVMVPDPALPFSRVSITGDELIIEAVPDSEWASSDFVTAAMKILGIKFGDIVGSITRHPSKYAKIVPIEEDARHEFLHWATMEHNVYSLGRFATWRPSLLLDDLVKDIRLIDKWAFSSSKYNVARNK